MSLANQVIVAYDISNNKTRNKIRKIINEWRLDGQKSVHECWLNNRQAEELFLQIGASANKDTDKLLMAWLEPRRKILTRGIGNARHNKDILHIGR